MCVRENNQHRKLGGEAELQNMETSGFLKLFNERIWQRARPLDYILLKPDTPGLI